ncbi:MAG: histidine kinase N-terminal 7TM domain-containing protein [bacterium]
MPDPITFYFHPWYHIITSIAGVCAIIIAVMAWQRRPARGAVIMTMLMCAVTFWTFSSLGEFAVHSVADKLFWVKLEYLGIAFCAPLWLIISMIYLGHEELITRRNVILLFIIPAITVLLNWTNEYHHLSYAGVSIDSFMDTPFLKVSYGPWSKFFIVYSYGLCVAVVAICLYTMYTYNHFYREQFSVIFISAMVPVVFNLIYVLRAGPAPYLDLTPMAFIITGALMVWGMRRYHHWDMVPVAYNMIVENISDGILVLDPQLRIISMNPAAEKYLGSAQNTAIGKFVSDIAPTWEQLLVAPAEDSSEYSISTSQVSPAKITFDIRVITIREQESQSPGRLIVIRDDTERNMLKERLQELAFYDQLTGLPNRALFMDRLEQALALGKRNNNATAVMFLDQDRFKEINDTLGHSVGDELLRQVGKRLNVGVRTSDTVARLGGDEFVFILSGVSCLNDINIAAQRFLNAFDDEFTLKDCVQKMTASVGISIAPFDGNTVEELMSHADEAMYRAKQQGANTYRLYGEYQFTSAPPPEGG